MTTLSDRIASIKKECEEIIKLSENATKGPWHEPSIYSGLRHLRRNVDWYNDYVPEDYSLPDEDAAIFIARSRNITPALAKGMLTAIEIIEDQPHARFCLMDNDHFCDCWKDRKLTHLVYTYEKGNTMIFTSTPPTEAGVYLFKEYETAPKRLVVINVFDLTETDLSGLWCQLTCKGSAQQRLATEVERAHREGWSHRDSIKIHLDWKEVYSVSRAARVAKGEE
jgi:hypothetical protein